jgi:hypothetical protein
MIKRLLLAALSLMTLIVFGCTGDTNTNSSTNPNSNTFTPKGTVTGVLNDSVTNQPIANADVYIMDRKATTGDQGQFTITDVPANTPVGTETGANVSDPYNVVIDLKNVNAAITTGAKYPAIAYHLVEVKYTSLGETTDPGGIGTNHDTPVNGFVANIQPRVGKLDGGIKIQVVLESNRTAVAGATVSLFSTGGGNFNQSGANTSTGNTLHLVAPQQQTDANGFVTFSNVEAASRFHVAAQKGDLNFEYDVVSGLDNITLEYLNNQDIFTTTIGNAGFDGDGANDAMELTSMDTIAPIVIETTPANLADIAAGSTVVKFTFSEPIKATNYALATTEATSQAGGLWQDVAVNFDGPKAGNIAHTVNLLNLTGVAPNQTFTELSITLTTVAASRYSVSINGVDLFDRANNRLTTTLQSSTVIFTTRGGAVDTAPVVTRTSDTVLDWKTVTNAVQYAVQVERLRAGLSVEIFDPIFKSDTHFDLTEVIGFDPFSTPFADGQVPVTYKVTVTAMGTGNVLSAGVPAAPVTLNDTEKPIVTVTAQPEFLVEGNALVPGLATDFVGRTVNYTFNYNYGKVMNEGLILDKATWTIGKVLVAIPATIDHSAITAFTANAVPALDITPTVKSVTTLDGVNYTVTLTFTQTGTAATAATTDMNSIVITAPATDVNGNVAAKLKWVGEIGTF